MVIRVFLLAEEIGKVKFPKDFEVIWLISGDDSTSMSLGHYLSPRGDGGIFVKSDIFVSLLSKHTSPLEVRIDHPLIPRENLCIKVKNFKDLNDLFTSSSPLEDDDPLLSEGMELAKSDDYDFFSGNEVTSDSKRVRMDVFKRMTELKDLTHGFIDAGFLDDGEDVPEHLPRKIDDWMVTFEDPLQKLFITYTLPETSAPIEDGGDITIEDEFLINPSFRKGITLYWMKTIANFMVTNGITTIEEVGSIGDWENPEVWKELKEFSIRDE